MGKLERRLIKFKKTHPYNVFNNRMRSLKRRWMYINWQGIFSFWRLLNEISMWSYEISIIRYDLLSNYTKGHRHAYIVYMLHIVAQSLSHVPLFATLWTAVHQASLSFTNSLNLLKLISMESVMSSNHLILCHSLLLFSSIFPSIRTFSNELVLPSGIGASASVLPMNVQGWFPLGLTGLIFLQPKGLSRVFSSTTVQKHQFFNAQPSLWSSPYIHTWLQEKP